MTNMGKYKGWDLLDSLPDGWKFDKNTGSPLFGYDFATNGKSPLRGQKRALVFVGKGANKFEHKKCESEKAEKKNVVIDEAYVRTVNELARKKFEQKILADIAIDLTICEIEGWCKMEYIRELRRLLSTIATRKSIATHLTAGIHQTSLFESAVPT